MDFPLVSIVIPTHNRKEKLIRLINSILNSKYPQEKIEIIIVDDASNDGTFETVKNKFSMRMIKIVRNQENQLVSKTRNIGFINSTGEYIFFVDDDVILDKDTIYELVLFVREYGKLSIVGPIIYHFDNPRVIWSAGIKINFWTTYGKFLKQGKTDIGRVKNTFKNVALSAAFMTHRDLINKVGLFNSKLFPIGFEELDFCVRSSLLGYNVLSIKTAKVFLEHKKGMHLNEHHNFYFGTRNRFIAHKLWSKNYSQMIVSKIFSIIFALTFLLLKSTSYSGNYIPCVKAIFKGVWDGIKISHRLKPYIYSLEENRSIKYEKQV